MTLPDRLRLVLGTPTELVVDEPRLIALQAEDETGSFGIRPGHADFVTALVPTVLRWRIDDGSEGYAAVGPGVLMVQGGGAVRIACREAVLGADLESLEAEVARYRAAVVEAARRATVEEMRLETSAIRQIVRLLRPGREPRGAGALAASLREGEP